MNTEPLAVRMRPRTINEIIGQQHILGPNTLLRSMIANDCMRSIILYGPPGTGKTTIARVIANTTHADFHTINAVAGSKKDIEAVISVAQHNLMQDISTILFIDEIHRFNKAQQDYLLPFVENGTVTLIGATTENPFFEVNPALMSRIVLFELKPLTHDDIISAIVTALNDPVRGLGTTGLHITHNAADELAERSGGDIRFALNTLEIAALQAPLMPESTDANGTTYITVAAVEAVTQHPHLNYDKDGDSHYDTISAFIKSMRGSDPDATLYYLAKMLESGEDPKFIARRIMIHACEDVGIADPNAICVATNAALAVERIGLPEGRIILADAALYIALAPKSNSVCRGIDEALDYVKNHPSNDIPEHLKDAHYKSAAKLGHGTAYAYPHNFPNHWINQQYLPNAVQNVSFYHSDGIGYQQNLDRYHAEVHRMADKM